MDNDKQVTDLVSKTRDQFLNAPLLPDDLTGDQFDLVREFQETKHNKNWLIPLILGGFLLAATVVAVVVSLSIDDANRKTRVAVEESQNLNLRDVLDTAKKNQTNLTTARQQLADAQAERTRRLSQAEGEARGRLDLIDSSGLPEDQKAERRAGAQAQLERNQAAIRQEWDPKIAALKGKVELYQKAVDEYDQRIGAMAKQQQELIANQQRLFNLEKQKQAEYYEGQLRDLRQNFGEYRRDSEANLKRLLEAVRQNHEQETQKLILTYNPQFTEPDIQKLIADSPEVARDNPMAAYEDIFGQEQLWTPEAYSELSSKLGAIKVLYDKVKGIPFTNSVPQALSALELRSFDIFQQYDQLWTKTAKKIRDKNDAIRLLQEYQDRLQYALDTYAATIRENGFVVDGRDPAHLLLTLQKIYKVKDGDTATVFRTDEQEVAKIELKVEGAAVFGRVLSLTNPKDGVRAFDRILLNLK